MNRTKQREFGVNADEKESCFPRRDGEQVRQETDNAK